nr:hypothetical protein MANES_01G157700 [Ipomoea batatas]
MAYTHHRTCYTRVRKPCTAGAGAGGGYYKGFRLNSRRFSVHRLRAKFFHLFRLLSRLKALYFRAVRALMKRSITGGKVGGRNLGITREINYALYGNNGGGERCVCPCVPSKLTTWISPQGEKNTPSSSLRGRRDAGGEDLGEGSGLASMKIQKIIVRTTYS